MENKAVVSASGSMPPRPSSAPPNIDVPIPPPIAEVPPGTNAEADDFAAQLRQVRREKHHARQQWLKDHPEDIAQPEVETSAAKVKTALQVIQAQRKSDEAKARAAAEARDQYLQEHGEEVAASYQQQLQQAREDQRKAYWARPGAHYARHPSEPQELYPGYRSKLRRRLKADQERYREIQRSAREKLAKYEAAKAEIDEANARAFEEGRQRREERHLRSLADERAGRDDKSLIRIAEEKRKFITQTALEEYCNMCKREEQQRIDRIEDIIREAKEAWRKEAIEAAHLAFDLTAAVEKFKEEKQRRYEERARQGDEQARWMSLRAEEFVFERMAGRVTPEACSSDEEIAAPASWGKKASPGAMPRGPKLHVRIAKETAAPPTSRSSSPTLESRKRILEALHGRVAEPQDEPTTGDVYEVLPAEAAPMAEDQATPRPQMNTDGAREDAAAAASTPLQGQSTEADVPRTKPSFRQRPPPPSTSRSRDGPNTEERTVNQATAAPATEAPVNPAQFKSSESEPPRRVPQVAARLGFGQEPTAGPPMPTTEASDRLAPEATEGPFTPTTSSNPPGSEQGEKPPECRPGQSIAAHMREKQEWRRTVRWDGTKYVKRSQPLPRRDRRKKSGLQSPAEFDNASEGAS